MKNIFNNIKKILAVTGAIITFIFFLVFPNIIFAETSPSPSWVAQYNGIGNSDDFAIASTADSFGNIYVTGTSYNGASYSLGSSFATIKYDSNGNKLWNVFYNDRLYNSATDIKVDQIGNVYVTGYSYDNDGYYDSVDFITIKYDKDGNQLWATQYNGGILYPAPHLFIDSFGNVYVAGNGNRGSYNYSDYIIIKYDLNGNQLWQTTYDRGWSDSLADLFVDTLGNIYITGSNTVKYDTNGNILWEANNISGFAIKVDSLGNVYILNNNTITKYDSNGKELLSVSYGGTSYGGLATAFSVDSNGNIYVTGTRPDGNNKGYATVKYDFMGNKIWAVKYARGDTNPNYITIDSLGNVYVAGGDITHIIIKYDSNGNQLWESSYSGISSSNHTVNLFLDLNGNIYVTGYENGINFNDYVIIKYVSIGKLSNFFSSIKNTSKSSEFRKTPGTQNKPTDDIIKTLPNDWVVKVTSTTDTNSANVDIDGYRWYQVEDLTDGSKGWMAGKNLTDNTEYLSYDADNQTTLEAKATSTLYQTKEARIPIILQAVDNYFTQTNTTSSLYGSGGGTGGRNNFQNFIQNSVFPKELILAMTAQESGSVNFNNEIVTFDYGHGILQSTFASNIDIAKNKWDNRGVGSDVIIALCKSILNNDYKKCYTNSDTLNNLRKPYQPYDGNVSNTTYKQYSNSLQSIYSNIKDGFRVIQDKYRPKCKSGKPDIVISGYTFTCQDIEKILTVWGYNGFGKDRNTGLYTGKYLKDVAEKLENLNTYFPGLSYSNTDFIQKMKIADAHKQVVKVYSPVIFNVVDSTGRTTGLLNDSSFEEIPNSIYESEAEGVAIFFPADVYKYHVVGTTTGTYGFSVDDTNGGVLHSFKAIDIPTIPGEIFDYTIDWNALDRGERGVTVNIDINGDGTVDRIVKSYGTLTEIIPPVVTIISPLNEYVLNSNTTVQFTSTDASGISTVSATLNGTAVSNGQVIKLTKPGINTLEVTAMDNEGNTSTVASTFKVLYATDGFLSPIKLDNTGVYNQGRTLPVKFKLYDTNGSVIPSVSAKIYVAKITDNIIGTDEIPLSSSQADTGNLFRYDSSGNMYIFNLSTDSMSLGTWQIRAVLDSGQEIKVNVSIR